MSEAIKYLRGKEWSMGNGQCPECCGVPASWHGHPCYMTTENIGHKANCKLAASLKDLGEMPLMIGEFKSDIQWESYITESGIFSTRHKTATGCPRYAEFVKPMEDAFNKLAEDIYGSLPPLR